ncbi:MAG: hypothetical protein IJW92_07250 [Clostridia bacterium]|nr:hypothetical protein [Clostridia bacterium]
MNNDSGFGANGAPFEYTVAEAKTNALRMKKITFVAAYVIWGVTLFIVGSVTKLLLPFIALVPLSLWILVFFTWKYTQVEYEYSFFSGKLTVSKIYGSRTRKKLAEIHIRDLSAVFPYEDANVAKAEAYGAELSIMAASGLEAPSLYIALGQDMDSGKSLMLCFEPNEKALKILKYYNMAAFAK